MFKVWVINKVIKYYQKIISLNYQIIESSND